ncbi:hypothetical protein [Micromonospora rhizosphaerae]|uniref:hypothetical protein n=1 Tax=Micromonospora rhizosphaerae TaxID=568872 RepID=UPI001FE004C8|nr:hypothetical protein [Micromonospora rhizosphaerae]
MELRVHGVAGAGAGQVLGCRDVRQVAGDRRAGFYRPRAQSRHTTGGGGTLLEAYQWSDLPSGTAARTLSLVFLLPFMLSNVAFWMRPAGRGLQSGVTVLCQLLALTLTLLYALTAAGVALDLLAWKCMGSSGCLAGRGWLSWLGGRPVGVRLALLALVPLAAVALVWFLGVRQARSYEAFRLPAAKPQDDNLTALDRWDVSPRAKRLHAIHVAAAFVTLDVVLLAARAAAGTSVTVVVLSALAGALLATCVVLLCAPGQLEPAPIASTTDRMPLVLRAVAGGLTVATLWSVAVEPVRWPRSDGLPRYADIVAIVFVTQTALLVALAVLVLWRSGGRDRRPALLRGLGAAVVATVATGLAGALSAELVYRAASLLSRRTFMLRTGDLAVPVPAYRWAILAFFLTTIAAVTAGAIIILSTRADRRRTAAAIVARDYPAPPPEAKAQARRVEKAVIQASFTEQLGSLAIAYACLTVIGLGASALALAGLEPSPLAQDLLGVPSEVLSVVMAIGSYLILAVVVGLLVGGLFASRTAGFRRYVGVLWDLGTFWPRAAHPFAPPSYIERAVPELTDRICQLTRRYDGVVLSGHSQGSVILAATVLRLRPEVRRRVALLTYASPLKRLCAQLYPAYLGEPVLYEIGDRIGWRWLNLWSNTDPIGGRIFSRQRSGDPPARPRSAALVDRRLRDPEDVLAPAVDSTPPPIWGHTPYESDDRYAAAVRELADRLRADWEQRGPHNCAEPD